jgi:hypothetical protein
MKTRSSKGSLTALLLISPLLAGCSEGVASGSGEGEHLAAAVAEHPAPISLSAHGDGGHLAEDRQTAITVYQTPTCGCCGGWVDHIRANGFDVTVVMQDDLTPIRRQLGIPPEVTSCHMGVVEGFAVEGHVPADVVHRLVRERPAVLGIAVPGMPIGSPGMEVPGRGVDPYNVYTFDRTGPLSVYATRP